MKTIFLFSLTALVTAFSYGFDHKNKWSDNEPVSFIERGIEFLVYPNGTFDFNARPVKHSTHYPVRGTRGIIVVHKPVYTGIPVERDHYGKIRRVGNVVIHYDNWNRVNRIGNASFKYNKFGFTHICGIQPVYNHCNETVYVVQNDNCHNDTHGYYYGPKYHNR